MLKKCSKVEKIIKAINQFDKEGLPEEMYDMLKKRQNNVPF